MTIRKKKILLLTLFLVLIAVISSLSIVFVRGEDVPTFSVGEFKEEYLLGETMNVPETTLKLGGKTYDCKSKVIYPDGRTSEYKEVQLDTVGNYEVIYSFETQTDTYTQKESFSVIRTTANQFVNVKGCEFTYCGTSPAVSAPIEGNPDNIDGGNTGVTVKTTQRNASFQYNGVIDLSALSGEQPFIDFIFTPEAMGTVEIEDITITLTDVYDSNNYVTMLIRSKANWGPYESASVIAFSANDMYEPYGIRDNNPYQILRGEKGEYTQNSAGSSLSGVSFYGRMNETARYLSMPLFMDSATNEVFAKNASKLDFNRRWKIFDFDDTEIVGANVWNGFKTGEVYMTVDITSIPTGGSILVKTINGQSLDKKFLDAETVPSIAVDCGEYSETALPFGKAGQNNYYPVFPALAYTACEGILPNLNAVVYYGLHQQPIPIKNNRFKTEKDGEYFIKYTATSEYGGTATKTLSVTVKNEYDETLNYQINNKIPSSVPYGTEKVYLYEGEANGGFGSINVETKVIAPNGEETQIIKDGLLSYFNPSAVGVYKVEYTITDITETLLCKTWEISVVANGEPILSNVYIPDAIRVGYPMQFAGATAKIKTKTEEKQVGVQVLVDGVALDETLQYVPAKAGEITVEYRAVNPNDETKCTVQTKKVQVLGKNTNAYFSSYFKADGFTYESADMNSIIYTTGVVTNENTTSSLYFANELNAATMSIGFDLVSEYNDVYGIAVTFYDAMDADVSIRLEIRNIDGIPVVYQNGIRLSSMAGSFNGTEKTALRVNIDSDTWLVTDGSGATLGKVLYTENGATFTGFSSTGVYVRLEALQPTGEVKLKLYDLFNQTLSNDSDDWTAPSFVFSHKTATTSYHSFGEEIVVPAAKAYDVMSCVSSLKLLVVAPNGETVYNGAIDKDYVFKAMQYGTYYVTYTAEDENMNPSEVKQSIEIPDEEVPTVHEVYIDKVIFSLGETLKLPSFTATDNYDKNPECYVTVIEPTGQYKIVMGNNYTFSKTGKYVLRFVAIDDNMNFSYREITVTVTEG